MKTLGKKSHAIEVIKRRIKEIDDNRPILEKAVREGRRAYKLSSAQRAQIRKTQTELEKQEKEKTRYLVEVQKAQVSLSEAQIKQSEVSSGVQRIK